ncbi:hypothetical protein ASPCAL09923 [Aspergillus calidoustus]|uniref:Uncharacterized protein n=1 Tax=Aspergillus calidoustus TaxID=454130 RepID=A0A0U5GAN9_ASPCI|nr:hypothetical protein ASPCAL09923 [Aspergillus calidoustus]
MTGTKERKILRPTREALRPSSSLLAAAALAAVLVLFKAQLVLHCLKSYTSFNLFKCSVLNDLFFSGVSPSHLKSEGSSIAHIFTII